MLVVVTTGSSLCERCSSKFSRPEDEGLIQHPTAPKVSQQAGYGLVYRPGIVAMVSDDISVGVPTLKAIDHWNSKLNKADSPFNQSAGDEALPSVSSGVLVSGIQAVELPRGPGLSIQRHDLGNCHLHACGEFIVGNRSFQFWRDCRSLLVEMAH